MELLRGAEKAPIVRPVDPRKLARRPVYRVHQRRGRVEVPTVVSVPEEEDVEHRKHKGHYRLRTLVGVGVLALQCIVAETRARLPR